MNNYLQLVSCQNVTCFLLYIQFSFYLWIGQKIVNISIPYIHSIPIFFLWVIQIYPYSLNPRELIWLFPHLFTHFSFVTNFHWIEKFQFTVISFRPGNFHSNVIWKKENVKLSALIECWCHRSLHIEHTNSIFFACKTELRVRVENMLGNKEIIFVLILWVVVVAVHKLGKYSSFNEFLN